VLLDVRMPRRDGISVAAELAGRMRVLMLTFSDEPATIRDALRAGAIGYLVHGQFDADDLVGAVVGAAAGTGVLSPPAMAVLRETMATPPPVDDRRDRASFGLTEREQEIMDLVAAGLRNGEIARRCFVAEKTVKNHLNRIFAKLGVDGRSEAIVLWLTETGAPA
jgi:DNA-binding NarL/FixJ family response regulator